MFSTDFLFDSGKLTTIMDGGAGSSGKGKLGAFVAKHADNWQFCCNTFAPQAGHWVRNADGTEYFYQTLNSCAWLVDKYEKLYLGPGSIIELPALMREMEENNIPPNKIGINPVCAILQDKDAAFERGEADLDGNSVPLNDGTMKKGSTCHGVGACTARRRLRRPDTLLARDIPELKDMLCDTSSEIITRLERGQAGLMEIAQGFQLSYLLPEMYPYCTSRNCTIAAGLDDLMVPPMFAGKVILNYRTFPIRISNYKYIAKQPISAQQAAGDGLGRSIAPGEHLTWDEVQLFDQLGYEYDKYEGSSGPGYNDQEEISWDKVTEDSGSPEQIMEITSVTKLPRRVFTFSAENVRQSIRHNRAGDNVYISLNFANYVDYELAGKSLSGVFFSDLTDKFRNWYHANMPELPDGVKLAFLGTGADTDEFIQLTI